MDGRLFTDPCLSCGKVERVETLGAQCSHCNALRTCPPFDQWPVELRRFITRCLRDRMVEHFGGGEVGWRHLLAMTFRNSFVEVPERGEVWITYAASPDDVFGLACKLARTTPDYSPRRVINTTE